MADGDPMLRYKAAIERVRLRAIRMAELGSAPRRDDQLAALERGLDEIDETLRFTAAGGLDGKLARTLGIGLDELDFLWTAVAMTADPRLWPHLQRVGGPDTARGASVGLHALMAQLDGDRSIALGLAIGPASPLLRFRLLEPADALPMAARRFVAPARVAAYLAGLAPSGSIDPILAELGGVVVLPEGPVRDDDQRAATASIAAALTAPGLPIVVVDGSPGVGRRTAVAAAAAGLGRVAIAIDLARLAPGTAALEEALAALTREVVLGDAVAIVVGADRLAHDGDHGAPGRILARALDALPVPTAVITLERGLELSTQRAVVRVTMPVPGVATRRRLWDRALASERVASPPLAGVEAPGGSPRQDAAATDADRELLSMRYRLGAGGIDGAVRAARQLGGTALGLTEIVQGVRNNIAERMGGLAQRIAIKQGWDELVLGKDTLDQVRALIARVQHGHQVLETWGLSKKLHRGSGVAALFSGPPGTGKTMVAGLIARALDLELYQVDLSKVVSKWVGETEKQLAQIFDAADAGHALLLFDEADALFAKRTEVKAAVDRYANLEVNYLLQRVEAFGGITVLTTNLDQSIDPALMRRLAAHVKFWPPEHDERVALWRGMLDGDVPLGSDVDFEELATRFPEMTGANIRNAAIAGAFLAASEDSAVCQRHLERAARGEYASMGRALGGQRR